MLTFFEYDVIKVGGENVVSDRITNALALSE